MNTIILFFSALLSALPIEMPEINEESMIHDKVCITADKIMKPAANWKFLTTEIKYQDGKPILEIDIHNPLNKETPQSVDAKFILAIDKNSTDDTQKYKLMAAYYYNNKTNVTFKRIYAVHKVKDKKKIKKVITQTPCFNRQVLSIVNSDGDLKEQSALPDTGVNSKE